MNRIGIAAVLLCGMLGGTLVLAQRGPREYRDITYATINGVPSQLDLYQQSDAGASPVVVYFHGGSWTEGERPKSAGTFRDFLSLGFSVLSVDYRMAGVAHAPAAVQDARCALAWLKANAVKYHFDTKRIVTYGTSAGGQLALLAALLPTDSDLDHPTCRDVPAVAAVLDYYGPADVNNFAAKSPRTRAWLGDSIAPEEMGRRMSPMSYVRRGAPPVFIVHGDADPTVPYAQSVALERALRAAGGAVELLTIPGGLHGKFSDDAKKLAMERIKVFLGKQHIIPVTN